MSNPNHTPTWVLEQMRKCADEDGASPGQLFGWWRILSSAPAISRCGTCDGTGQVHSPDGEWRGACNACDENENAQLRATIQQLIEKGNELLTCHSLMMTDVNHGASCYQNDTIQAMNTAPGSWVRAAHDAKRKLK